MQPDNLLDRAAVSGAPLARHRQLDPLKRAMARRSISSKTKAEKSISASRRLAALALAAACITPVAADAMDDFAAAIGNAPTELALCGGDDRPLTTAACKESGLDTLAAQIDSAFAAALANASASAKPLLKRDQVWFGEIVVRAAESIPESGDHDRQAFVATLSQRVVTLEGIAAGFGRPGITGRWASAFGSVAVSAAGGGAYHVAIDARATYGAERDQRSECRTSALVRPEPGGWLSGKIPGDDTGPGQATAAGTAAAGSAKSPTMKIRRQGETLRVVVIDDGDEPAAKLPGCRSTGQITASYFASAEPNAVTTDKASADFVAPTFDCAHPATASDEEICADPDLAQNDRKLNHAWKALLPRLDPTTRRALIEDQRGYIRAQSIQYPEFLHPAWDKTNYFMHSTGEARDMLGRLQLERIVLLEGFDESRSSLVGVWLAYNAILEVKAAPDGSLTAQGWKWTQGDWKAGCDYEFKGKVVNGTFRSEKQRKNPDTLERDHASLIVNRPDDFFAEQRDRSDNAADTDEGKCKRNRTFSSTARLFPTRPSPNIDNRSGSIR
jgi:uncharacterized protein YecT (DUF1311 family)